jgi:hypothetical protein
MKTELCGHVDVGWEWTKKMLDIRSWNPEFDR